MTYISQEDEEVLDKGKILTLTRGDKTFNVEPKQVYCYGEVNFNNGSSDLRQIDTFGFLNHLSVIGVKICSDYKYEDHTCYSPIPYYRWTETFHPAVLAQYAHGCLGKPERIVLFKSVRND